MISKDNNRYNNNYHCTPFSDISNGRCCVLFNNDNKKKLYYKILPLIMNTIHILLRIELWNVPTHFVNAIFVNIFLYRHVSNCMYKIPHIWAFGFTFHLYFHYATSRWPRFSLPQSHYILFEVRILLVKHRFLGSCLRYNLDWFSLLLLLFYLTHWIYVYMS